MGKISWEKSIARKSNMTSKKYHCCICCNVEFDEEKCIKKV